MKLRLPSMKCALALILVLGSVASHAVPVSHSQVRIVTGMADLTAGSYLELRIYEAGKAVKRVALTHGEAWPRDSTRVIPLTLNEAIDPRNVQRFAIYYRPSSAPSEPFEIIAADVELPGGNGQPQRLLGATLSGVIVRQGELATAERAESAATCHTDADCDDRRTCNGRERCSPHAREADARGCVAGTPVVCPVNQVCGDGIGCHGLPPPR